MIPNKQLSKNEVYDLIIWNKLFTGGEAIICGSDTPFSVYKIFTHVDNPIAMPENKVKKISRLYDMQVKHSVQPLSTISLNDVIVGYEMTSDIDLAPAKIEFLPPEEQSYFLTKTKEILEYFSSLGIIYGDIEPRNILFNRETGEIEFCDMDNIAIDGIPMDLLPPKVREYSAYRQIDENIHPFMHNSMTLRTLGLDAYFESKYNLRKHFKRPAIKTILSMREPQKFNNEYIAQYIKK